MTTIASQITSFTSVYSTVYSDADQRKHQSSASLAFVWGIHRDRWIPRTKGQLRGKCFHLMTSSWEISYVSHIAPSDMMTRIVSEVIRHDLFSLNLRMYVSHLHYRFIDYLLGYQSFATGYSWGVYCHMLAICALNVCQFFFIKFENPLVLRINIMQNDVRV